MRISILQGPFLPVPALRGGAIEKAWLALGKAFAAAGHEVTHISRAFEGLPPQETIAGVKHLRVKGYDAPASLKKRLLLDFFYTRRALAALPPSDLIATHTFWSPLLYRGTRKGRLYVHVGRYPKGQLPYYNKSAILQTVSEPIRQAILAEVPDAGPRTSVLPYPLSEAFFGQTPPHKTQTLLYTGRLHPEKGLDLLIDAFRSRAAQLPTWKLKIVGPHLHKQGGAGEDYLQTLKAKAGEAPIEFTGPIFDENKLIEEYRAASVFAYPSLAERGETFGLSVLEAMSGGAVPIVSSLGCFADFVKDKHNGLVFDHRAPDAAEQLAGQLARLASDQELRHSLATAAITTAASYRIDQVAANYLEDFTRFTANLRQHTRA